MSGRFLTIEGLEGVGKSTQIHHIREVLEQAGKDVLVTREPGGTELAERIRRIVLEPGVEAVPPESELLLMFAARSLHLHNLILPALREGNWVVCDRFTDATYAYQGSGRGLDRELIRWLESLVHPNLRPDLTILLDAPLEDALERARDRNAASGTIDRFEQERVSFHSKVRQGYLELAQREPERFVVIDASRSVHEVSAQIDRVLEKFIEEHDGR